MTTLPRLRQVILLTADLEPMIARAREAFALREGIRDVEGMAALGFAHEVLAFNQTFLEITAPIAAESPQAQLLQKQGDSGFMVALQVGDLAALVERATGAGMRPVMNEIYDGHPISQWHPKDLGTLSEIDEMEREDTWHFAPECFEVGSTEVAQDVVAADIAVDDPESVAARWGVVLDVEVDGTIVCLPSETLRFVPAGDGPHGLRGVDLVATDPARIGDTVELCGVTFRFVSERQEA